jgi:cyclopropane fatty-acyl-phospholipid synthase-like methyltransferase
MLKRAGRIFRRFFPGAKSDYLGIGKHAGDAHYRAYVGPPRDYDLVAAMCFNLLTTIGLRQHHRLLDVGCGSLRLGRLFVPYLNVGNYVGVEPNAWLVEEGIRQELGAEQVGIKQPTFLFESDPAAVQDHGPFDYAVAQSIFSHCDPDMIRNWLHGLHPVLAPGGVLLATYLIAQEDSISSGWTYPGCVSYRPETMRRIAEAEGFRMAGLDWRHPRQTWAAFLPAAMPPQWFESLPLTWNNHPIFQG